MTTGFQPNAFQPDAFQAHGGVTSGITVNINATQDGDSGLLTVSVERSQIGAPGPRNRFVVYINGKRFYGTQDEINRILRDLAREDADTVLEGEKPPKRRIVVQAKRIVEKPAPGETQKPQVAGFEFKLAQDDFRRNYLAELSSNILRNRHDDDDDETVLMLIEQDQQQTQRQVLQMIQSILERLK